MEKPKGKRGGARVSSRARFRVTGKDAVKGVTEGLPCCPHCGGAAMRNGTRTGRQMYRCRVCLRSWFGALPDVPSAPCPFCGGECFRHGVTVQGVQKYRCRGCGVVNTDLYPQPPKREAEASGPMRFTQRFLLDPMAVRQLNLYCNARKMSAGQAIRAIFRSVASPPMVTGRVLKADKWGVTVRLLRTPGAWVDPEMPMPRFPSANAKRGEWNRCLEGYSPVCVECGVTVRLDPLAYKGLARVMAAEGMTHQQAARWLIKTARVPE